MLTVVPATIGDLAELQGRFHARYWKGLVVQVARSIAWSVFDGDELLAIAGLYPTHPDYSEVWLAIAPHVRGSKRGRALVRVLIDLAGRVIQGPAVAAVKAGHAPGLKLAKLAGFREVGTLLDGRLVQFVRH